MVGDGGCAQTMTLLKVVNLEGNTEKTQLCYPEVAIPDRASG